MRIDKQWQFSKAPTQPSLGAVLPIPTHFKVLK
jgi:hypothetical protein